MGAFTGFGKDALKFFTALKFHQSKEWFDENRALYDEGVLAPLTALLDDLTARFAAVKIPLRADGKRSVFRIHRDVRFAKDKSPYKTHAGAVMTRTGKKDDPGLLYVHISPDGCFVAAGFHMPEPEALASLRKAIKTAPKRFDAMVAALKRGKLSLNDEDSLSRLPRGFEDLKDSPYAPAVRLKSFIVEEKIGDAEIRRASLVDRVVNFGERALPLLKFGWESVK